MIQTGNSSLAHDGCWCPHSSSSDEERWLEGEVDGVGQENSPLWYMATRLSQLCLLRWCHSKWIMVEAQSSWPYAAPVTAEWFEIHRIAKNICSSVSDAHDRFLIQYLLWSRPTLCCYHSFNSSTVESLSTRFRTLYRPTSFTLKLPDFIFINRLILKQHFLLEQN